MADSSRTDQAFQLARTSANKQQQKAIDEGKIVESVNTLPPADFFRIYKPEGSFTELYTKCERHDPPLRVVLSSPKILQQHGLLDQCFKLVEESSAHDYKSSEIKWSPASKRREMKLPEMRYIVLLEQTAPKPDVVGFASFMITYEDGYEVVYIYEIHFTPRYQGQGFGKLLMDIIEQIGTAVGVEKVMLTVFRSNDRAVKWYHKLEFAEDAFSPEPRVLRNGTVKEASYVILSKVLNRSSERE